MNNRYISIISSLGIISMIALTLFLIFSPSLPADGNNIKVTIYKSPNCGCCVQHSAYLRGKGYDVTIKAVDNMASIKAQYQIPRSMQSCHTAIIGDYFVEGHVPVEAIEKLLTEKPAIDGIALPEMPSGSPGMPGPKLEPFVIYQLKNGKSSTFITL